jgi:8-oxo-dGTP pyrophosphatase MutT (NUDIX family)
MVQKRYTYFYVEFVLGHYNRTSEERLVYLFNNMTNEEKIVILSLDFGKLWYKIWLVDPESVYAPHDKRLNPDELSRYNNCKKHFERSFLCDGGERLRALISKTRNNGTVWEIPKGRAHPQELPLESATREVEEETGISSDAYRVLFDIPVRKTTTTNPRARYENNYYTAVYEVPGNVERPAQFNMPDVLESDFWWKRRHQSQKMQLDFRNDHQLSEVINMRWMSLENMRIVDVSPDIVDLTRGIFKLLRKRGIGGLTRLRGY